MRPSWAVVGAHTILHRADKRHRRPERPLGGCGPRRFPAAVIETTKIISRSALD